MHTTLIIYEYPAANYDILHWIERFKSIIISMQRYTFKNGLEYFITIEKGKNTVEHVIAIPFARLKEFTCDTENETIKFDKLVVVGRIPIENKSIMRVFNKLCTKQEKER
jgi:hypothetical protein